ncbi:hypothetical protein G7Z17_g2848 [Cylindrodendrum hubeiense]|uniref:Uncharacterized protein n=1 Tax=Cylindrodendrum hubeiense TaxID=595255 RepID=A0A9P5HK10_9HYPO|nr:hypothetical protein G7Z17_g2848 [Cylindrodendrum hubeiense]
MLLAQPPTHKAARLFFQSSLPNMDEKDKAYSLPYMPAQLGKRPIGGISSPPLSLTKRICYGLDHHNPYQASPSSYQHPTDPSTSSRTGTATTMCRLVSQPDYRLVNLGSNKIFFRCPEEDMPEYISALVKTVKQKRNSPRPSMDDAHNKRALWVLANNSAESKVCNYFINNVVSQLQSMGEERCNEGQLMMKSAVPSFDFNAPLSTPKPDLLYGYDPDGDFPTKRQAQLAGGIGALRGTNAGLACPFFAVEFKGVGPSGSGSL